MLTTTHPIAPLHSTPYKSATQSCIVAQLRYLNYFHGPHTCFHSALQYVMLDVDLINQ